MGPDFDVFYQQVFAHLTSKNESHHEKRRKVKLEKLIAAQHQHPDNAIIRRKGVDIPAHLHGMLVFSELCKEHHSNDLDLELNTRHIVRHKANLNFTEKKQLLRDHEQQLWMQLHPGEDIKNFTAKAFRVLSEDALFTAVDDEDD